MKTLLAVFALLLLNTGALADSPPWQSQVINGKAATFTEVNNWRYLGFVCDGALVALLQVHANDLYGNQRVGIRYMTDGGETKAVNAKPQPANYGVELTGLDALNLARAAQRGNRSLTIATPSGQHTFGLRGSTAAVGAVLAHCGY